MEKELVRFENVTSYNALQSDVKNLSFSIYEGQMAGMVAVNDTGIEVLLNLLQTNTRDNITGKIYVRGKLVHNQDYCESAPNNISIIDYNNRLFKGLSTIDNIFVRKTWTCNFQQKGTKPVFMDKVRIKYRSSGEQKL